jgi:hypothetical protein
MSRFAEMVTIGMVAFEVAWIRKGFGMEARGRMR